MIQATTDGSTLFIIQKMKLNGHKSSVLGPQDHIYTAIIIRHHSFFIIFFKFTIYPTYNPLSPAITALLSMSMSPVSFLLNPSTLKSPIAVSLLSIYESVSIFLLLVQIVH